MQPRFIAIAFTSVLLLCAPDFVRAQTSSNSVTMIGAQPLAELLLPATIEAFARDRGYGVRREIMSDTSFAYVLSQGAGLDPAARFDFRISDTSQAILALASGSADVALTVRSPTEMETQALPGGVRSRVVALDALVAIVARDNPVGAITRDQLFDVVAGTIDNWSDLGGPDQRITLHLRDAESGMNQQARAMGLMAPDHSPQPGSRLFYSNADLADAVAQDISAIGLTWLSEVANARVLGLSGACGFVLPANRMTIKTEDYPFVAPLSVTTDPQSLGDVAQDFLAFLVSDDAQGSIRQSGFADFLPETEDFSDQADRLAKAISQAGLEVPVGELRRMVETLSGKGRLSTTVRFKEGSKDLTDRSATAVDQLAAALAEGVYSGRTLTIVGFSDGVGSSAQNLQVGRSRAAGVEQRIRAVIDGGDFKDTIVEVDAFGEGSPLACDDTEWGRNTNRRVEIWID